MDTVASFFSVITLVLIAISIHEFAHAWMANYLGDSTARYRGRVTIDPLAHLDPIGTMMILFSSVAGVGIGWGKPVPVIPGNFKNPPQGLAISSAAGPLSNLAQAILAAALLGVVRFAFPTIPALASTISQIVVIIAGIAALASGGLLGYRWYRQQRTIAPSLFGDFSWKVIDSHSKNRFWEDEETLKQIVRGGMAAILLFGFLADPTTLLIIAFLVNVGLALFNLIPLGPLDGNGILRGLLLSSRASWTFDAARFLDRIDPYSSYILLGLIFVEQFLRIPVLSFPIWGGTELLARLLGVY